MVTEEEIKKLAHAIWEAEGYPEGKDLDHYFRAKRMLEEREAIQLRINKPRPHPASSPLGTPPPQRERYW